MMQLPAQAIQAILNFSQIIPYAGFGLQRLSSANLSPASTADMAAPPPLPLRIITYNVRFAEHPSKNERPWSERCPLILNELLYNTRFLDGTSACSIPTSTPSGSSFLCLQEVLHGQLQDVLNAMNNVEEPDSKDLVRGPLWSYIGVGREDGESRGEYSPILYPVKVFEVLHSETVWLSPTPDRPSKGWDADQNRIMTLGVFKHKATGRRVIAATTHLDNAGTEAREKSVGVMLDAIDRVRSKWSVPSGDGKEAESGAEGPAVFLAGDFNSFPTQEAYLAMKDRGSMGDLYDYVPAQRRYRGDSDTFTGFQPDTDQDKDEIGRIDFVWLGPKDAVGANDQEPSTTSGLLWNVKGYAVLPNKYEDGVYSSDHRCVIGDTILG